jgi:hypothetical protein
MAVDLVVAIRRWRIVRRRRVLPVEELGEGPKTGEIQHVIATLLEGAETAEENLIPAD